MNPLKPGDHPRLTSGHRLQWEPVLGAHVLLYPEGMVRLNETAAAILSLCDGGTSCRDLLDSLKRAYEGEDVEGEAWRFLDGARYRGWIEVAA